MATILSTTIPDKALHFFTHLHTIVRAAHNFEGTAWATYDVVHRRKLANRGSLDWRVVNCTICSEAFMGRVRLILQCSYYLADTALECFYAPMAADAPVIIPGSVILQDLV